MADQIPAVIQARYLVAALGESNSPPWWRSEATTAPGRRMLERLYPRTVLAASLEVASRAARSVHDSRIGRLGTYHLFRLPVAGEAAVREYVASPAGADLLNSLVFLEGSNARLAALIGMTQGQLAEARGPIRCGSVSDLHKGATLAHLCALYAHAFTAGEPAYPYLDGSPS